MSDIQKVGWQNRRR